MSRIPATYWNCHECPDWDDINGCWRDTTPDRCGELLKEMLCEGDQMNLRERLADLEHQQWVHLTKFFMNLKREASVRDRYGKLCRTPYSELPEDIKDKDRIWADKVLKIIREEFAKNISWMLKLFQQKLPENDYDKISEILEEGTWDLMNDKPYIENWMECNKGDIDG